MAASEYYNPSGLSPHPPPSQQGPTPGQQPTLPQSSMNSLPYPISDAPPPYSLFPDLGRPQSHSQPPPMTRPQPGYAPAQPGYFPPGKQDYRPHNVPSGPYTPPPPQGSSYPPPKSGYPYANGMPPKMNERPGRSPYREDYDEYDRHSRSRSRSRSRTGRHHHHHHHHDRPKPQKRKSNGVATFLGAGGGAIIGDAIFPGLGTLGGAVLGGLGGHEYGKQRRSYSDTKHQTRGRSFSDERDYYDGHDNRGRRH